MSALSANHPTAAGMAASVGQWAAGPSPNHSPPRIDQASILRACKRLCAPGKQIQEGARQDPAMLPRGGRQQYRCSSAGGEPGGGRRHIPRLESSAHRLGNWPSGRREALALDSPSRPSLVSRAMVEVAPPVEEVPESGLFAAAWHVEQGLREEMEDIVTVERGVPGGFVYAGVFDGHEGKAAAEFLRQELYGECLAALEGGSALQADDLATAAAAVSEAFRAADARLLARLDESTEATERNAGSTASVVFARPDRILVAHAGDSRVVLCRAGEAEDLTQDHRPKGDNDMAVKEVDRIKSAGGWVSRGRVCGYLAVSRAFGDVSLKTHREQMLKEGLKKGRWTQRFVAKLRTEEEWVTAEPDVFHAHLGDDAEFVIMASDGLWDALRSSEAVFFVRQQLKKHADVQEACRALVEYAIQERKADDNVSAVLLRLR